MQNLNWYHNLNQPAIHPPDWIFAPVWSLLYLLMFASLIIFLTRKITLDKKLPGLLFFIIQLTLNILWSPVFFYRQDIKAALIICAFLFICVIITTAEFYKHSKLAAYLLVPYLLWSGFALYLNFELERLN